MDNRTQEIKSIFSEAYKKKTLSERMDYLDKKCGAETDLRADVESLLKAYDDAEGFLKAPILNSDATLDDSAVAEGPGTVIGRYKLLERIGEGGMAVVYMAEQEEPIRRKVALKIIKLGMDTKSVIARFEAERQALAIMDHPNIAKVLDAGATETGRPYFVMELVTGVSITEYCDKNNLSTKQRLALFIQVCNAVQHAHQKGIIHRDIKPTNVMVTQHEGTPVPKVIDFGIAKATNQRLTEKTLFTRYAHIIGTPAYMSPEQADMSDMDIDTRSDIYSLGVLLYELLAGATPFSEEELHKAGYLEMQRVIREEEPPKPSTKLSTLGKTLTQIAKCRCSSPDLLRKLIRGDLDWIVMKSLDKDRARRYTTASEFTADIERHLNSEPVLASPPSKLYQMKKFVQRHRASATLAAAIMIGFVVSTAMFFRAERSRREMDVARAEAINIADFLANDLLASVYPERAKSQQVTVRYILENAAENLSEKFVDSPLAEARVRETLGLTYQKMGDLQAAAPHLQRALEIRRAQLGEEDPATLASKAHLGQVFWYQDRYEEAESLLVEAFEKRQRVLGNEHPDTLTSMLDLGSLYRSEARSAEGTALIEQAYQIGRHAWGEDHPVVLHATRNLAWGYMISGQLDKAEPLSIRGLKLSRRVLGDEHQTTLFLMNTAVSVHTARKRFDTAMKLAKQAVEISQRVGGEGHVLAIHALSNLGSLYFSQGRHKEGIETMAKSLELSRRVLGEDRICTLWYKLRLALMYREQGQYEEHENLLIESLDGSRRLVGENHPLTRRNRYWLLMRVDELGALAKEQENTADHDGAILTLTRLRTCA